MADQFLQQIVNRRVVDHVIIVQHQDEIRLNVRQVIQQSTSYHLGGRQGHTVQHRERVVDHRREYTVQRLSQTGDEDAQIVIMLVQRQPGMGDGAGFQPGAE